MLKSLLNQFLLSDDIAQRLGNVLNKAATEGDTGVMQFVNRAVKYTVNGKLRARDLETLQNLERTYNRDYYRGVVQCERVGGHFVLV